MQLIHNLTYAEIVLKWSIGGTQGENCMKAKGDDQDRVHSDQMVLVIVSEEGWTSWAVAKGKT